MRIRVLDESLDVLVVAMCQDYFRRKSIIEKGNVKRRIDTELRYLNYKIYDAATEVVGEENAELFIKEIGSRIGYAASECSMSESIYKTKKRDLKIKIAKNLYLTE